MRPSPLKAVLWYASLLVAGASASSALSLSVLPAQPVERTPFTLAVGLEGACVGIEGVVVTPGYPVYLPGVVTVTLTAGCGFLTPPTERILLEVPIGPLQAGRWEIRVQFPGGQETLQVDVEPLPFSIDFNPVHPQEDAPFTLLLEGTAACPTLEPAEQDGKLLTLRFSSGCPILSPPPGPFEIEQTVGPLPGGDYVVQVVSDGSTIAARRLHVFGPLECIPSETALCLQNGRFRVEATWKTPTAQGVAGAHPETADSGSLWFFGPENLELMVKVLDGCGLPSPRYWVFAAGLTNVEVELVVTEMITKQVKRYRNPLNRPFAPIQDTGAFPCVIVD
ncbi:MAG TPA: hypothetical protein VGX68_22615 [Thermoanaerobaculia bacterium]|nr:hypothetical protein [Thermoanaerobaculia bacterium]